jgi:hypothetical protein
MNGASARGGAAAGLLLTAILAFGAGFAVLFWTRSPSPQPPAAPASALVYPANPRYLTDSRGEPRFLVGIYRFFPDERVDWLAMLDRAQADGLNAVRTIAIADGFIPKRNAPESAPWPFKRNGGGAIRADRGPRFNLAELDDRFWNNYRDFLAEAERRNITVVSELFGVSGPFDGRSDRRCAEDPADCFQDNLWHQTNSVGGPVNRRNAWHTLSDARRDFFHPRGSMRAVQERILDRYLALTSRHGNVVYQPANEFFGDPGPDEFDTREAAGWLDAMRDAIRSRRRDATVLLNVRDLERFPHYGIRASGFDGVTIHAPHNGNVGGEPYSIEHMIEEARVLYPAGRFFGFDEDVGRPYTCDDYQDFQRQAAWTALTVGAGSYILLEDIFFVEPWCNRCNNPCPRPDPGRDLRYLAAFLRVSSLQPWELAPDSALVARGTATALGNPERGVLLYLRSGPSIELDLTRYPSAWTGEWYDPRRGETFPAGAVQGGRPQVVLTPPGDGDWVLSLRLGDVD